MPNMDPKKNPMPTQEPQVRAHNFSEVALGYSEETAVQEALRCLNCKNYPCVSGCPVNIHIPEFISKIKEGDFEGAYQVIQKSSSLPAVCGRVCPQETQCESKCVRGIKGEPVGIGRLERFVADWHNAHATQLPDKVPSNGHKVAIVGSGPSGLTCAGDLAKKGYQVTVVDGNNDQAKQNEQINTFITQGVDALIINPVMTSAADTIIATVKSAGIPTVLINREPTAEQMAAYDKLVYVGCDAAQSGTFQGELILETPNGGDINGDGKISYIMIQGDPENIDAQLRTEYSVKALTDAGKEVEQLNLTRGDWDREKGQTICANDLAQFGDKIEVVFCNNDDMAIGALQAIQAAGRKVNEDIYLVGVDALDAALNEVSNGNMTGTVLNDANGQAAGAVAEMEKLLGGATYASGEQSVYVDYVKVTPENVSDFMK